MTLLIISAVVATLTIRLTVDWSRRHRSTTCRACNRGDHTACTGCPCHVVGKP